MKDLQPFQWPFAQARSRIAEWTLAAPGKIELADVIANAHPTVLIGTSGQGHAFSEKMVREMARHVTRPVIFPLSNPTDRSEATPEDLLAWTDGRAIIGTGSPFPAARRGDGNSHFDQTNNAFVYPGVGLGVIASKARRISDGMFLAAARALAELSPAERDPRANLLPPLADLRKVSFHVARAVGRQAQAEGLADASSDEALTDAIKAMMWDPVYASYRRVPAPSPVAALTS
jgi:malate dehydrogenase (oxaloacetate-decarboxylating)